MAALILFGAYMFHKENHEFKDSASGLSVHSEKVHAEATDQKTWVSCIGEANNTTEYGWRDIAIEARYFDAKGTLIDTASNILDRAHLPANGSTALRVMDTANHAATSYASCKLTIKDAKSR